MKCDIRRERRKDPPFFFVALVAILACLFRSLVSRIRPGQVRTRFLCTLAGFFCF